MASGHRVEVARGLRALCGSGAVGLLGDAELVERFVEGSEPAFEALVARHGPLVLRVAREVLGDRDGAQDVFQATFLVLARKAGSIGRPDALGPWLHGVAHRVARKARVQAGRRRRHEAGAASLSGRAPDPTPDPGRSELAARLHDEVARLPESCRLAVVLCYFQGMTYEGAARHLGLTEGAVRGRLARARRRLRARLGRLGLALPLRADLDRSTGRMAREVSRVATGQGAPSAAAGRLAEGVLRTMMLAKWKLAAALIALAAGAAGAGRQDPAAGPPKPPMPAEVAPAAPAVPPSGPERIPLTLDAAIERLLGDDALAARYEIPRARADLLTAGLRGKPASYADADLVFYGTFVRTRPGGPTPSDILFPAPPDVSKKRRARAASASRVIEAEYLDAVRHRVAALCAAFVEAQAARDLAGAGRDRVEMLRRLGPELAAAGALTERAESRLRAERKREDAEIKSGRATRAVASLLGYPEAEADRLDILGDLDPPATLPPTDTLVADALANRPDLAAFRIGFGRAQADVRALASPRRAGDSSNFWPYTPTLDALMASLGMASTPAIGDAPPWRLDDAPPRSLSRARLNVGQADARRASLERQVAAEVVDAARASKGSLARCRAADDAARLAGNAVVDAWAQVRREAESPAKFRREAGAVLVLLAAIDESAEADRLKVEARAAHRKARLAVDEAVGHRLLP